MVTTNALEPEMIEPQNLSTSHRYTLTARKTMEVSPVRLLYVLVSNFSDFEIRHSQDMKIIQTSEPLSILQAVHMNNR